MNHRTLLLLAGAALALFGAPRADAANCGGSTPCKCGDTLTSGYTMSADLDCSAFTNSTATSIAIGATSIPVLSVAGFPAPSTCPSNSCTAYITSGSGQASDMITYAGLDVPNNTFTSVSGVDGTHTSTAATHVVATWPRTCEGGKVWCALEFSSDLFPASGSWLDCDSRAIIGPSSVVPTCVDNPDSTPGCKTGTRGLYAYGDSDGRTGRNVKNCTIRGFERGAKFSNVSLSTVQDSKFVYNARYGFDFQGESTPDAGGSPRCLGNFANCGAYGNLFQRNAYSQNGDEGIHIAGRFRDGKNCVSSADCNQFIGSIAEANKGEGFYLLRADNVKLGGAKLRRNDADDNGKAGLYVKASDGVLVSYVTFEDDYLHIVDDSDDGHYSYITIAGGFVKLENVVNGGFPKRNTFDYTCVIYSSSKGQPASGAFVFKNVAAATTSDANTIANSAAMLTGSTNAWAVEVDDQGGIATNNNSFVELWVVPWGYANYRGATAFLNSTTWPTKSFINTPTAAVRPACFGLTANDFNGDGNADILWRSNQ